MNTFFIKITLFICGFLPLLSIAQSDTFYDIKSYNHLNDLAVDSQYIWAATTSGVVQRNKVTGEICGIFNGSNAPFRSEHFTAAAIAEDGTKWFGARDGFLYSFDDFEWTVIDSLESKVVDIKFDETGTVVPETFTISYTNYCGNLIEGTYRQFQQNNGELWSFYRDAHCTGSSTGCSCAKFYQLLRKWDGAEWQTIFIGEEYETIMTDFVVDDNDVVWMIKDSLLMEYQFQNSGLDFIAESDLGIGKMYQVHLQADGLFWLFSEEGVFTFDGTDLTPAGQGLDGNFSFNLKFDPTGVPYGFNQSQIFKFENNEWQLYENSVRPSLGRQLTYAKNDDLWFAQYEGMTLYNGTSFEYFTSENSVLVLGENEIVHADSQSGIWVNKLDTAGNHRLFYFENADWVEIDATNSNLIDLEFTEITSDSSGRIWFKYANPSTDSIAMYDFQNWVNFATLDEFNAAFYVPSVPEKWVFSNSHEAMLFVENGDTTFHPIDIFPFGTTDLNLGFSLVSQDGHAWVVHYNPFISGSNPSVYMFYFNGENWASTGGWYLQTIKYAFTRGNKAWFLNEDTTPTNGGSYGSGHYYEGGSHTEIDYPATCGGTNNYGIHILNMIEIDDHFWLLCNLSKFTINGTSSSCSSKFLIKMTGADFVVQDITNMGGISKIEKDHADNIYAFRYDGFSRNKPILPILQTFSKPNNLCNSGRTLACVTNGGLPPFNYQWNNGETNPLQAPVNPGNYSVTVTDTNANTQVSDFEVGGQGTFLEVQSSVFSISCAGEEDGHIEAFVSGGTPPYQYAWADGAMQPLIEFLPPGEYALTVTDAEGCTTDFVEILTEPEALTLNVTSQNPMVGQNDGSISTTAQGGTSPYTYLWNTGATTSSLSNISDGSYTVTISDYNGCTIEQSFQLVAIMLDNDVGMNAIGNGQSNELEAAPFRGEKQSQNTVSMVFPNPFADEIFIHKKDAQTVIANLQIYNVFGQKMPFVSNENAAGNILKIETREWNSGAYFVQYQIDSQCFAQKVVKH